MKNFLLFIIFLVSTTQAVAQILFSNSFGNLSLQSYSTSASSVQYTTIPNSYSIINDGYKNNIGAATNPNKPFNVPNFKTEGWAIVYNAFENDTFMVSTSWLDTTTQAVNRWVITPSISNISANSVLTWLAKSPDINFLEGYSVYGTNLSGSLTPQNFTAGDLLYSTVGENSSWTRRSVSLAAFAGQTLRFAFRNNSTDKYQIWIDDIEVITLPNSLDATINGIDATKYVLTNSSQKVSTTIKNLSATAINSVALNYQIGNSTIQTETTTFTAPLVYNQTAKVTFLLPYTISTAGNYKLKTWLSALNNSLSDQNQSNDTAFTFITVQASSPKKSILVEQFVSALDGESPDAQQKLLQRQNDSVIVVNVHDLDSLKEPNSIGLISAYKKNTSTALFDRTYFSNLEQITFTRTYYDSLIYKQLRKVTPASISIINKSYNTITRELAFTIKVDFIGEVKGDLRLNAYLTENNVHGSPLDYSLNGYNQLNNFYNVPWSPYYQMGTYFSNSTSILNSYEFQHQNTLVHSFNGSFGNSGVIPTLGGTQGQSYQETFTLTIPTPTNGITFNADNLYIVGFLAEYNTSINNRTILNVAKIKITNNPETVGLTDNFANSIFSLYPNPSNGIVYLNSSKAINNYNIKVIDITGRCVLLKTFSQVDGKVLLDFSNLNYGVYFINISHENGLISKKIIIQK